MTAARAPTYPDTEAGARAALAAITHPSFCKRVLSLYWYPCGSDGEWHISIEEGGVTVAHVYLAGYCGRRFSDFEATADFERLVL